MKNFGFTYQSQIQVFTFFLFSVSFYHHFFIYLKWKFIHDYNCDNSSIINFIYNTTSCAAYNKQTKKQLHIATLTQCKVRRFKKIAWIQSHHLQFQWKFKLLAGKFNLVAKAKHCWVMSTSFLFTSSKLSRQ